MTTSYAEVLGAEPSEVVQPTSAEAVAEVVARANTEGKAVIPWGGGTGQTYGYPPRRADALLDLSTMDRILAHEPGDLTVTVQAGSRLADVQAVLAEHGQFLPLDPPHAEAATLGGILATDAFGPSRVGYGTARDWLIGLVVIDAQGRQVKGGGKVVKNVTGYDLPKLHVGALGTLGVIVEATFKVAPKPEASDALLFTLSGADDAAIEALLGALRARRVAPALSRLHDAENRRHLFLIWSGLREVVAGEIEAVAALARTLELPAPHALDPRAFSLADPKESDTLLRFSTLPADIWRLHRSIAAQGGGGAQSVHTCPYTGITEVSCSDPEAAALLLAWATRGGVSAAVLQAPLSLRGREGVELWRPLPPSFPLMQGLKQTLDPNATLNPGRFVGRI